VRRRAEREDDPCVAVGQKGLRRELRADALRPDERHVEVAEPFEVRVQLLVLQAVGGDREDEAADLRLPLEDGDGVAPDPEVPGRHQARRARADHRDPLADRSGRDVGEVAAAEVERGLLQVPDGDGDPLLRDDAPVLAVVVADLAESRREGVVAERDPRRAVEVLVGDEPDVLAAVLGDRARLDAPRAAALDAPLRLEHRLLPGVGVQDGPEVGDPLGGGLLDDRYPDRVQLRRGRSGRLGGAREHRPRGFEPPRPISGFVRRLRRAARRPNGEPGILDI